MDGPESEQNLRVGNDPPYSPAMSRSAATVSLFMSELKLMHEAFEEEELYFFHPSPFNFCSVTTS